MGGWRTWTNCSLIGAAYVSVLAFSLQSSHAEVENLRRQAGSEVYIQQPPKNAIEKDNPGAPADSDKGELKPAAGPTAPSQGTPRTCDSQNASSEACYTATQQARPVPR